MKFVPLPKFPTTSENLNDFREIAAIPGNIATFSSQAVLAGAIPAEGAGVKPWRDNSPIWFPNIENFDYSVVTNDFFSLTPRTMIGDAGIPVTDVAGITALEGFFSGPVIAFYNRRVLQSNGKEFSKIPKLMKLTLTRGEAKRLNILNPSKEVDVLWPVSYPLPVYTALRFNPVTNVVEAFNILEYEKAFPVVSGALSDEELIGAVQAILASPMSAGDKAKAIRLAAK